MDEMFRRRLDATRRDGMRGYWVEWAQQIVPRLCVTALVLWLYCR